MRVSQNPAALQELLRRTREHAHEEHPRAEGVHVSDIVRCRRQAWYKRNGYPESPPDTDTLVMFMLGQGHHAVLQQGQEEVELRITLNGIEIIGNVDADEPDVDGPTEIKTTRKSSKAKITDLQHYLEQLASYCVMQGKHEGRVYVFHLLGDWKGPKKSSAVAWDIEFTWEELARWRGIMEYRAGLIMSPQVPPLSEHRDWECQYCPLLASRGGPCEGGPGSKVVYFQSDTELEDLKEALRR